MQEARASWNTVFLSKEGFECQITLRDEDEVKLTRRAEEMMEFITRTGGIPLRRRYYIPEENTHSGEEEMNDEENPEKEGRTYIDENGVRRCNRRLKDGRVCGYPVTRREGRYGPFWSCPNFREHASYREN